VVAGRGHRLRLGSLRGPAKRSRHPYSDNVGPPPPLNGPNPAKSARIRRYQSILGDGASGLAEPFLRLFRFLRVVPPEREVGRSNRPGRASGMLLLERDSGFGEGTKPFVIAGVRARDDSSAHHRQHVDAMVANLIRRERQRQEKGHSGLMVGDDAALFAFQDVVRRRRPTLRVTVVQPGLSRAKAQTRHLQLLGAADAYVAEVADGAYDVWGSA
jgi:hypothetical protein